MNRKMIKKILALCCSVAVLSLGFIACGSKDDNKDNSATQNPTVSPTEQATATTAPTTAGDKTDGAVATNLPSGTITGGKPGTYTATAKGYASDVKATVKISEKGLIEKIDVDASGETETIGQVAAPKISKEVVDTQSLDVDTVSGATYTSTATLAAIKDALTQAGIDTTAITQ